MSYLLFFFFVVFCCVLLFCPITWYFQPSFRELVLCLTPVGRVDCLNKPHGYATLFRWPLRFVFCFGVLGHSLLSHILVFVGSVRRRTDCHANRARSTGVDLFGPLEAAPYTAYSGRSPGKTARKKRSWLVPFAACVPHAPVLIIVSSTFSPSLPVCPPCTPSPHSPSATFPQLPSCVCPCPPRCGGI